MTKQNVYTGHRYIPLIDGLWDQEKDYEGLTIVTWEGNSYTSKKHVPSGVDIKNEEYWVLTGNYNAQVENYRQELSQHKNDVNQYKQEVNQYQEDVDSVKDKVHDFDLQLKERGLNVKQFKASGSDKFTTGTISSGSNELTVVNTIDFKEGEGIYITDAKQNGEGLSTIIKTVDDNRIVLEDNAIASVENVDIFHDDTIAIQKTLDAVSNGGKILIPQGTYMIDALQSVSLPSNTTLNFDKNATFKAIPNDSTHYQIIKCIDKENVTINGGVVEGERDSHLGSDGEWGYGLQMRRCTNITVNHTVFKNCWGDGVLVGKPFNRQITLNNVHCDNNRRQGVSVIAVEGLYLNDCLFENTNGTKPEAGIDFEPDGEKEALKDIYIHNLITKNNEGAGIKLYLEQVSDANEQINLHITNHIDYSSKLGFQIENGLSDLDGFIHLKNSYYKNNGNTGIFIRDYLTTMPNVNIDSPTIINPNAYGGNAGIQWSAGIAIYNSKDDNSVVGNINLKNVIIKDTRNTPNIERSIFIGSLISNPERVENVNIFNPLEISGYNNSKLVVQQRKMTLVDQHNVFSFETDNHLDRSLKNDFAITNLVYGKKDTGTNLTLENELPIGFKTRISSLDDTYHVGIEATDGKIFPSNDGTLRTTNGGTVELEKIDNNNTWLVVSQTGDW